MESPSLASEVEVTEDFAAGESPRGSWMGFLWLVGCFWAFYLLALPLFAVCLAVPTPRGRRIAHRINVVWGYFLLAVTGIRVRKTGSPPGEEKGPFIYVSNHRSYLDIPILHVALKGQYRFLGKRELGQLPLFGFMFSRLHIVHDRRNPSTAVASLRHAASVLAEGTSLVIFPEGTSRTPGRLGGFKEGAFALATESQRPLVPIAIRGSRQRFSPLGPKRMAPGRVHVRIGVPIAPGTDAQALRTQVRELLAEAVADPDTLPR